MNEEFTHDNSTPEPLNPDQVRRIEEEELAKIGVYSFNDPRGPRTGVDEWEPYQDADDPMPFELRARWASVMLDMPPDSTPTMPVVAMLARATRLKNGAPFWHREADEWHEHGFTPELYLLLHNSISHLRRSRREDLESRLIEGIPGALEELERFEGSEGIIAGRQMGFRGDSLRPADWAELPQLILRYRPSQAISMILAKLGDKPV